MTQKSVIAVIVQNGIVNRSAVVSQTGAETDGGAAVQANASAARQVLIVLRASGGPVVSFGFR